ncbi:hypothetical protein SAY86_013581 [Trapa natans]|uniref:Uncharacterized protein n=1 Tax=Trapa natans TaxID=22666 RepID=A0AAN7KRC1_TRANT|nr:hypothetical protein SAY86_013581 [Trapa natans]
MEHLDLSGVDVTNCRSWQSLSSLSSLRHLGIAGCFLNYSSLHVNFTSIEYLDLSDNALGSAVPNWLLNLTNIRYLDLSSSFQEDLSFPTEIINNNKHLGFLHMFNNPTCNLCELYSLRLSFNHFTGDISSLLANPSRCFQSTLRFLDISWNNLSGHLGDEIRSFKSLEYIDLAGNFIKGPIPESLFQLSSLKYLNLMYNQLTGDINHNRLTGMVTEQQLANLTRLIFIEISLNKLVINISAAWIPPFQLKYLSMSYCQAGPNSPDLEGLNLSVNQLVGQIHQGFGDMMTKLRHINFKRNRLDGRIPASMCKMMDLFAVDLLNNSLSGPIPNCWRSLRTLDGMDFGNNNLTGHIPESLCSLPLTFLGLRHNNLQGLF